MGGSPYLLHRLRDVDREGEVAAMGGVLSTRCVGRDAIVGARPPLGGHVVQRASVDGGLKPCVSAQRGSNKH